MPQFDVIDPQTGRKLTLIGDAPPTEAELEELFAEEKPSIVETPAESERKARELSFLQSQIGVVPEGIPPTIPLGEPSPFTAEPPPLEEPAPDLTLKEMPVAALKGAGRGILTAGEEAAKALAGASEFYMPPPWAVPPALQPEAQRRLERSTAEIIGDIRESPIYKAGVTTGEFKEEQLPLTPAEEESIVANIPETAGSMLGYVAAGPAAPILIGAEAFTRHIVDDFDKAKEEGLDDDAAAEKALKTALASGGLQAAAFAVLPPALRNAADRVLARIYGADVVAPFLARRAAMTTEVAGVMTGAAIAENAVTGQPLLQGVPEAAGGGALLGLFTPKGKTREQIYAETIRKNQRQLSEIRKVARESQRISREDLEQAASREPQPVGERAVPGTEGEKLPVVEPQAVAERKLSPGVQRFVDEWNKPDWNIRTSSNDPNVVTAYDAGLGVRSIDDLNALLDLAKRAYQEGTPYREKHLSGQRLTPQEAAAWNLSGTRMQYAREAIEMATNTGSAKKGISQFSYAGDRPMEWEQKPEAAEWLGQRTEDLKTIGLQLPENLPAAKTPTVEIVTDALPKSKEIPPDFESNHNEVKRILDEELGKDHGVEVIYDPELRNENGQLVNGVFVDGKMYVNSAGFDFSNPKYAETVRQVAREEGAHKLIASEAGQRELQKWRDEHVIPPEFYQELADANYANLDNPALVADEYIAKIAREKTGAWQQLVDRFWKWLADRGLVKLTRDEAARALLASLKKSPAATLQPPSARPVGVGVTAGAVPILPRANESVKLPVDYTEGVTQKEFGRDYVPAGTRYSLAKEIYDRPDYNADAWKKVNYRLNLELQMVERMLGKTARSQGYDVQTVPTSKGPIENLVPQDLADMVYKNREQFRKLRAAPDLATAGEMSGALTRQQAAMVRRQLPAEGQFSQDDIVKLKLPKDTIYALQDLYILRNDRGSLIGENGKVGASTNLPLYTCHPSERCANCYAADTMNRPGQARKAIHDAVFLMLEPEQYGRRVADEAKRYSKSELPFIRMHGSGEINSTEHVRAFNEMAKTADRPIHVFSRRHDLLSQLRGTKDAPFIKMGSIDNQLVQTYGIDFLARNLKERGIANAYLYASETDIPILEKLYDRQAVDLILAASKDLHQKLPERLKATSCPCDAGERNYLASCRQCAMSNEGCFMAFSNKGITPDGKVVDLMDPVFPESTPMTAFVPQKEGVQAWKAIARDIIEKSREGIKSAQIGSLPKFVRGESSRVRLKDIRRQDSLFLGVEEFEGSFRVLAEVGTGKWGQNPRRTVASFGTQAEARQFVINRANQYVDFLTTLIGKTMKGTFWIPGGEIQPGRAYREGRFVGKEAARAVRAEEVGAFPVGRGVRYSLAEQNRPQRDIADRLGINFRGRFVTPTIARDQYEYEGITVTVPADSSFDQVRAKLRSRMDEYPGTPEPIPRIPDRGTRYSLVPPEAEQGGRPTAMKYRLIDQERIQRGLEPIIKPQSKSDQEVLDRAEAEIAADPSLPDILIRDLNKNPRAIDDWENHVLLIKKIELRDNLETAAKKLVQVYDQAQREGTAIQPQVDAANARVEMWAEKLEELENASRKSGSERGRALRALRVMLNDDFTLAALELKVRAAKGGAPLTPDERATLVRTAEYWKQKAEAFEQHLKQKDIVAVNELIADALSKAGKQAKKAKAQKSPVQLEADINGAKARIKEKVDAGEEYDITSLVRKLARMHIESGVRGRDALIDAVHADLETIIPGITRTDTMNAISGYGDYTLPSKDATTVILNDLRGQIREVRKLEDMAARIPPKRTGRGRQLPSQEERILTKQVQEAKKRGGYEVTDPETQLRTAMDAVHRRLQNSIADLEKQIAARKKIIKNPPELVYDQKANELKARRDELRKQFEILFPRQPLTDAQRLAAWKKRSIKRIAELEERMRVGDYNIKPRATLKHDAESMKIRYELDSIKRQFNEGVLKLKLANQSRFQKAAQVTGEVVNTFRALKASLDLSAVLRQGGFIVFAHPIRGLKSFPAMLKAARSKAGQYAVEQEILRRENYPLYERSGLQLTEHGAKLSQMEEAYMSRWAEHIPGVAASQRAYTVFLNKLRADSFDAMAKGLAKGRELTLDEAKIISNFINVATGRGNIGMRENALVGLNTAFFAPRLVASRFQLLFGQPLYHGLFSGKTKLAGSMAARRQIAKEYGRFLIGAGVVYSLAQMMFGTQPIEDDPRSADFGKIRMGNTRIDPMAGLIQASVLLSRVITGKTKNRAGELVPIRGEGTPIVVGKVPEVVGRFLRTKLSPAFGTVLDIASGENVVGEKIASKEILGQLALPLSLGDIFKAMREQGVPAGTALALLSIFGMGIQTYDLDKKSAEDSGQRNIPIIR